MSFLFAAIGATMTAVLEVTLASYLAVGEVRPHPVLIGGVIWTIAAGIDRGISWAFAGGLVLDALLGRPLGASAFALLVAVGGAALMAQPLPRLKPLLPVLAVPVLSLAYSLVLFVLTTAAHPSGTVASPFSLFAPGAVYDAVFGLMFGPLVVSWRARRTAGERVDW